ncbi:hypothetical protein QYE76_022170 [Lolium multiflorum]|uniref:Integrase catalytic domain-containing protein n=1 Tax=Lolium multiflorum TaxID=4521 RepID=A0AAD8VTW4_LOLMU|nr:hypothetical protein QYE76_022170 [Lolium multiflorum]
MDRGQQVETDLVDFIPHPPSRLDACAYLEEPIVMTFGEFRFGVDKEGSYRLEVPISSELSAIDSDFSSSDEEFASPRFINTKASGKLTKIFSDTSFVSSADSIISSDSDSVDSFNFIDRSAVIGKVFTNLYDGVTNPDKNQNSKYHQVYATEETNRAEPETSEAFDDLGNPYVDPADLRRGLGTKYVGTTPRLRVQLPQAAWDRAAKAMDGSEPMTTTATAEELQAYQYRLARVMNQCDAINESMVAYKEMYNELEKLFDGCEVNHISRLSNDEADVLANIGSQCLAIPPGVFWEEIAERSTKPMKPKKKEKDEKPSGATKETLEEEEEQELVMMVQIPWMQAYISYILRKTIPDDPIEARRVIRRSKAFTVVKGELYKRSISGKLHKASPGGYEYMLFAVDKFTKWIEAKPINSPDGASAIKFVKSIVFRFGVPHSIVTDNGSNFTSKEFKAYCAEVGIKLHFASVAHPQTNGQVEKANGIICNEVKKIADLNRAVLKPDDGEYVQVSPKNSNHIPVQA